MKRLLLLFILGVLGVVLGACGPSAGPFRDYYVDPYGEDRPGRGTESEPWRTVQYALDHATYTDDRKTRINLSRGYYEGDVEITRPVVIQGVGRGTPAFGPDPLIPLQEVSAIRPPGSDDEDGMLIAGPVDVEIYDLTVAFSKITIQGARVYMSRVDVINVIGLYGIDIDRSPTIEFDDIKVATSIYRHDGSRAARLADLGIRAEDSVIEIRNSWIGNVFDHPIDLKGQTIATIVDNTIEGSFIHNADGIRLTGDVTAEIIGNEILRLSPDVEPGEDNPQWPHAGIAFGGDLGHGGRPLVHIEGNTIAGFDVGIGITTSSQRILAQNNDISALTYIVAASDRHKTASWWRSPPVVDFGDGYLGSAGGNTFRSVGEYGFWLEASYSVDACNNEWQVPADQIPERIYDLYDDPIRGVVYWDRCERPRVVGDLPREVTGDDEGSSSSPLIEAPTATFTPAPLLDPIARLTGNAFCRSGPGTVYPQLDSVVADSEVPVIGRSQDKSWLVVTGPNTGRPCWVARSLLELNITEEQLDDIPVQLAPPTPTPTAEPTATPTPVLQPPDQPSNLSVSGWVCNAQVYTVELSWFDAADNESGYRVYRNGNVVADLGSGASTFADQPPYGGPYTYTVEAYNGAGDASASVQEQGCIY
ncbi:MAG: hypothetical protein ACLFWD_02220 [Anaerolineales bacterium]